MRLLFGALATFTVFSVGQGVIRTTAILFTSAKHTPDILYPTYGAETLNLSSSYRKGSLTRVSNLTISYKPKLYKPRLLLLI